MEQTPVNPPSPKTTSDDESVKPTMLGWWGIVPMIIYVVIQFVFGWDQARSQRESAFDAAGILVSSVMIVLVISIVLAWLVYRYGQRTQRAATITLTIMFCFFSIVVVQGWSQRQMHQLEMARQAATPVFATSGEFQFDLPPGWKIAQPEPSTATATNMAMIVKENAVTRQVESLLQVDAGRPRYATARQFAEGLAGTDGQVFADAVVVDGVEGVRVEIPCTDMSRPRIGVVIFRGSKVYSIMLGTRKNDGVSEAFDHVLKTWRWRGKP